ncbi:PREDICTED: methylsterol monooxygenase 1-like [Crocodylus porosus]|uniref:methylsterol monooxygenase 1-like n=1 Tax=Crocodylus porosus TaxID=8502 RepID=UPI00093C27CF|nr:PREDICTED: methylsterol monooxygenase 1-like [Crocodylus porosus]
METSDSPLQHNLFQESFRDAWTRLLESSTKFHVVTWGTLLLYLSSYYLSSLPGFIYQFIPAMKKYKIQQDKPETWEDQWKCFKMTFYHTLTIQTPMCLAVYIYIEYVDLPCDWNSMPRWLYFDHFTVQTQNKKRLLTRNVLLQKSPLCTHACEALNTGYVSSLRTGWLDIQS